MKGQATGKIKEQIVPVLLHAHERGFLLLKLRREMPWNVTSDECFPPSCLLGLRSLQIGAGVDTVPLNVSRLGAVRPKKSVIGMCSIRARHVEGLNTAFALLVQAHFLHSQAFALQPRDDAVQNRFMFSDRRSRFLVEENHAVAICLFGRPRIGITNNKTSLQSLSRFVPEDILKFLRRKLPIIKIKNKHRCKDEIVLCPVTCLWIDG